MLKLAFTALRQRERCTRHVVKFLVRKEWLAALIGVALAGVPMAAFNLWVDWFIEQRGHEEVEQVAQRSLAMAERRVGMIVRTLSELAKRGVVHCSAADIDSLRSANFWTTPIKEISVIGPTGQTLCTDIGVVPGERVALSSHPLTADGSIMIEVLRFGGHRHPMIQIRRVEPGNVDSLAALTPAELFLPLTSISMDVAGGTALAITTGDGFPLSESGVPQADARQDKDRLAATVPSGHYNLVAVASLPRQQLLAAYSNLRAVGTVVSGLIALTIIGFALIFPHRRRGDPVDEIERAFKAGELVPYFQPVVDITSGRLRGAEVLVRWRKPDGSLVLPGSFIPLLESSGLILEVTRMLMRRVVAEVGEAYSQHPKLKVSFNLAAAHFADETIVRDVREIFEDSPIRLNQVTLELTERQPLENLTETRRVIAALQGLGVSIAIDDVGTGHSGLSYMLKLGVDTIKIDKMFIDAIGTDRNSATIIETLIELARNLRMDIVAEGVESFEQVVFLRDLGIRAAQGYVFAPPLPASSYLQLVAAIDPQTQASVGLAPPPAAAGPKGRPAVA
jgi:sensor c-di-GMP phosphodiesterase-like protein